LNPESTDTPLLSVILVSYNDRERLAECLASIDKYSRGIEKEIIVADNHSADGSVESIRQFFPGVRLIVNADNVGFSRANNQGLRLSRGEFVLFLNTDTALYEETLRLLLAEISADPSLGAIGPALRRSPASYQVSFGREVHFFSELVQKGFLNPYWGIALKKRRRKKEVGWLSGAFLLVRKKAVEEAGFFDDNFFLYFEDIDLCRRIKQRGWKLIFFPRASAFHYGGSTTRPLGLKSRLEYRRSQLYYYRKHNSKASLMLLKGYLRLSFTVLWIRSLFKGRSFPGPADFFLLLKEPMGE
jgi:hypothetical protein